MPGHPRRPDDAQIVHDLQVQSRMLRNQGVERDDCKTFIIGGAFDTSLVVPPAFVAEHCSMSGVLTHLGAGSITVILHAHEDDSFKQSIAVAAGWNKLWEQPWAEQMAAGDPFWITVSAVATPPTDLAFGVVFGGESKNTGGDGGGGGGGFT